MKPCGIISPVFHNQLRHSAVCLQRCSESLEHVYHIFSHHITDSPGLYWGIETDKLTGRETALLFVPIATDWYYNGCHIRFVLFVCCCFFFGLCLSRWQYCNFNVYPQKHKQWMKLLLNYATFYKTSNRVVILIININLHRSHWLLSVSVLEVTFSDWAMSQRPLVLKQNKIWSPNLGQKSERVLNRSWFSGSESEFLSIW